MQGWREEISSTPIFTDGVRKGYKHVSRMHGVSVIRCGFLLPSSNTTVEQESVLVAEIEPRLSFHFARMPLNAVTEEELTKMSDSLDDATRLLHDAQMDIYAYACTSGSFMKGMKFARSIASRISKITEKPAFTAAEALIEIVRVTAGKKTPTIALATPYTQQIAEIETQFLEKNGINVGSSACLGVTDNTFIGRLKPDDIVDLAARSLEHCIDRPDVLLLSCTNMPTFPLSNIENELGVVAISSNSALVLSLLRSAAAMGYASVQSQFELLLGDIATRRCLSRAKDTGSA